MLTAVDAPRPGFATWVREIVLAGVSLSLALSHTYAASTNDPARVRISVRDHEGHAVPNCEVKEPSYFMNGVLTREAARRGVTDAAGRVEIELCYLDTHSIDGFSWNASFQIERDGFMPVEESFSVVLGEQLERQITLVPKRTTVICVCDSSGQGLPSVDVDVGDALNSDRKYSGLTTLRTDERGEGKFVHSPLKGQLLVIVNGVRRTFDDEPVVKVQLSEIELAALSPLSTLEGKLLRPDGTAAAGWRVASDIVPPKGLQPTPCCFGCPPPFHWTDLFVAKRLESVGADGSFRVVHRDQNIVFVSPQGIPLRYPLAPRSWTGVRHVTVRLPPIRRVHKGQLVFEDGTAVTNGMVVVTEIRSRSDNSKDWSISFSEPGDSNLVPSYDTQIHRARTDKDGRYEVPVYFGSRPQLSLRPLGNFGLSEDLIDTQRSVLHPMIKPSDTFPSKPFHWRRVTFVFQDEKGQRITDMQTDSSEVYQGEQLLYTMGGGWHHDARGGTIFYDPRTDRLQITTGSPGWKPFTKTFDFKGDKDPVLTITVPESHRLPRPDAIDGQVLDPDGKAVTNALVRLLRPQILPGHGFSMRDSYSWETNTDANGSFSFPDAPDLCEIAVSRIASDGLTETLPGWYETQKVTLDDHHLVIQLQQCGSVKVLLPDHIPCVEGLALRDQSSTNSVSLGCEISSHGVRTPSVRPGKYRLIAEAELPYGALLAATNLLFEVKAGAESLLDLRSIRPSSEPSPRVWTELKMMREGKPASGVIVSTYARSAAIARPFFEDLSNDDGQVRVPSASGQQCVVVAHDLGRWIGHTSFATTTNQSVRLELKHARTLAVRLNEWKSDPNNTTPDSRTVTLRLLDVPPEEAAALYEALALTEDEIRARHERHIQRMKDPPLTELQAYPVSDQPLVFMAEDMPVGTRVQVRVSWYGVTNAVQHEVTVEDGAAPVQELLLTAPARP